MDKPINAISINYEFSTKKSIQETELLVQQELEDADRTRGNIELTPLDVNMDF